MFEKTIPEDKRNVEIENEIMNDLLEVEILNDQIQLLKYEEIPSNNEQIQPRNKYRHKPKSADFESKVKSFLEKIYDEQAKLHAEATEIFIEI